MDSFKRILKSNKIILILLLLTFMFISPTNISAAPIDQKVYDNYDLFTDTEEDELEETLNTYGDEGKVDIVVITTDDLGNRSKERYLEDFYDDKGLGYDTSFGDTVLLLIYMNPSDRSVELQGYKNAEYYINNERIEYILDAIIPYLSTGDYYQAVKEYAKQVSTYMNTPIPSVTQNNSGSSGYVGGNTTPYNSGGNSQNYSYSNNYNYYSRSENLLTNPLIQLAASLIIAIIAICIMISGAGGRVTTNSRTYLDAQDSRITRSYDNYIRTTTTRVKKPTDNNNNNHHGGSGGGGGVSSGGHSHSGGGRGF